MIAGCAIALSARADLPLTVEDLLTAQNRWRAELSATYSNSDRNRTEVGPFAAIQTGPSQFITFPTLVGESRRNSDILALSAGLRYGVNAETEVYGRLSALAEDTRITGPTGTQTQKQQRFGDAWAGINHRFVKEGKKPALLGFFEAALAENVSTGGSDIASGKSYLFGLTTYRATDPVVLAATIVYRLNRPREVDGQDQKPGNFFLINPSVAFAVNDEVTLTTGLQWRRQQADEIDGTRQGIATTRTDLNLGLGYAWDKRLTLNFTTRANISGPSNAEVGFVALYKLGELPKREQTKSTRKEGE